MGTSGRLGVEMDQNLSRFRPVGPVHGVMATLRTPSHWPATTSVSRRMRSLPPGYSVVRMVWSPRPAAKASSGIVRSPE